MKSYTLTTAWNEDIEITELDFSLFMGVIKTDDNIYNCEIFTACGQKYVAAHLEDFTGKSIPQLIEENELDQALEEFFTIHLFGVLESTEPFSEN